MAAGRKGANRRGDSGKAKPAKAGLAKLGARALDALYEDLWAALGPQQYAGVAAKRRAMAKILRAADAIRIRTIIDPLDQKGGRGGIEASKRYALYEDGQTVADFILKHGDGPHLRLDVQRGNIRLAPVAAGRASSGSPAPGATKSRAAKSGAARRKGVGGK